MDFRPRVYRDFDRRLPTQTSQPRLGVIQPEVAGSDLKVVGIAGLRQEIIHKSRYFYRVIFHLLQGVQTSTSENTFLDYRHDTAKDRALLWLRQLAPFLFYSTTRTAKFVKNCCKFTDFLDASTHLNKRLCPSVRWSIRPLVCISVMLL